MDYYMHSYYMQIAYKGVRMTRKMSGHCHGRPQSMEHFLEISLLVLLYDEKGYGYALMEQLEDFGFSSEQLNIGSLYRVLRRMETDSLVLSSWEQGGQGPRRRIYEITEEGRTMLSIWSDHVRARKAAIEHLLDTYEKKIETGKEYSL